MKGFARNLGSPVLLTLTMMLVCGLVYPLLLTGVGQLIMPWRANGSLIELRGKPVGSELIGQDFTDPRFMKCRPSAVNYNTYTQRDAADGGYTGIATGSQNFAPTNPALTERVRADMDAFLAAHPGVRKEDIPADLLTASGSGLDPHISPAAAEVQIPALAQATGLSQEALRQIVAENTRGKLLGVFGEDTVNVPGVNLDIAERLGIAQ